MLERTGWWLSASDRDEQMARHLLEDGFYEGVAFHAQQAAEKALKALMAEIGVITHTHSCVELLERLVAQGFTVPPEVLNRARRLDQHYVDSRYPNGVGGPPLNFYDEAIAQDCLSWMTEIRDFVRSNLP